MHEGTESIGNSAFINCTTLQNIDIPVSVDFIGFSAFENSGLTQITLSENITRIRERTFSNCSNLTLVNIQGKMTEINNYAFLYCTSLGTFMIPDGVTDIGISVFEGCEHLSEVIIPESLVRIGNGAFIQCSSLDIITYNGTAEQWNSIEKGENWDLYTGNYVVNCSDGTIPKKNNG